MEGAGCLAPGGDQRHPQRKLTRMPCWGWTAVHLWLEKEIKRSPISHGDVENSELAVNPCGPQCKFTRWDPAGSAELKQRKIAALKCPNLHHMKFTKYQALRPDYLSSVWSA
jgi:hypothetical protein